MPLIAVHHSEFTMDLSAILVDVAVGMETLHFVPDAASLLFRPDALSSFPPFSSEEAFVQVTVRLKEETP